MVAITLQPLAGSAASRFVVPTRMAAALPILQGAVLTCKPVDHPPRLRKLTSPPFAPRLSELSPQTVTLIGAAANVFLSILKLIVGMITGSASLIADAGHGCSDLIVDGMCILAVKAPSLERVCTAAIAWVLGSAGTACVWTSVAAIAAGSPATSGPMTAWPLVVALVSIAGKEALYRITATIGVKHSSSILLAAAKHHRSDAISSVAAAVGSGGVLLGFQAADPLAAAAVGAIIIKMSVEIASDVTH